ncbi:MAG: DUF4190 domain-containing protein, partial [Mycobacteriaceae bacterium]|nr:DUF4190 domain-containing protein [Mycobacteriaceae bacterium]
NGFPPTGYAAPLPYQQRRGESSTLATLSVVFAFVCAPVGIALGHLALSQIRLRGQGGRERALVGLTVSYAISFVAVMSLIVMAAAASSGDVSSSASPSTSTAPTSAAAQPTTTEVTPTPPKTQTVNVDDLQVGDCVEVEQTGPDPNRPGYDFIKVYSAACQPGDNIYRVDRITSRAEDCPKTFLVNTSENLYACISRII